MQIEAEKMNSERERGKKNKRLAMEFGLNVFFDGSQGGFFLLFEYGINRG